MSKYKRQTDLYFTEDGDYTLADEDLEDTSLYNYRGFVQRVLTEVFSQKREWNLQQNIGAGIADFLGQRNTSNTGERIKARVFAELTRDNLISSTELKVFVFPIEKNQVAIVIEITPSTVMKKLTLTFSYDMRTNRIVSRNIG